MRPRLPILLLAALLVAIGPGCGGSDGPDATPTPSPTPTTPPTEGDPGTAPPSDPPQVVLLGVGGHTPLGIGGTYLESAALPWLQGQIEAAGYTVETHGFVDASGASNGFAALVQRLTQVAADYVAGQARPSQVVLLAHSHGGPWAHAATRDVPACPIRCLVDLDTNSYGWALTHTADNAVLGGSPDNAYTILVSVNPPAYPGAPSEPGFVYDLEDVIFPSVRDALEVVTHDQVPDLSNLGQFHRYDERWNARLDGTLTGLQPLYVQVSHTEPVLTPAEGGTTLVTVKDWILTQLAMP